MRTTLFISATITFASFAQARPTEKRTPLHGLLDSLSGPLGNDPVTMAKALPDKHIDPSPLGIDNMVSTLPLPDLGLKRGLGALDGLMGMTSYRSSPLGSPVEEQPGDVMPVKFSSFVPLNGDGSPIAPSGGSGAMEQSAVSDLPIVGDMGLTDDIPLEPLTGLLGSLGDGIVKRREKRGMMKHEKIQWSGAQELDDYNDAPHWG